MDYGDPAFDGEYRMEGAQSADVPGLFHGPEKIAWIVRGVWIAGAVASPVAVTLCPEGALGQGAGVQASGGQAA
jgi:hypothetical protein